jgi:xanthine/CO dehydrogenase XdhC/CoxF family maturation factor
MVWPIGIRGTESEPPAAIAASVAADLLVVDALARKALEGGRRSRRVVVEGPPPTERSLHERE